jgi:hypothetical protein
MDEGKGKIAFLCVTSQRGSAVVKQSTNNPECEGSDPCTTHYWNQLKIMKKGLHLGQSPVFPVLHTNIRLGLT